MTIAPGDTIPDVQLKLASADGAKDVSTKELFASGRSVLFGVPGAFTPTCSNNHLPGFVENRDAIGARGVERVVVVAVNDHHVMAAWARFAGAEGKIEFLADGNGEFVRALGLDVDLAKAGMGVRSQRFSMIIEDGVVKELNSGDAPGQAEISGAARILEQL
ncbi:redoxin family protein [Mesorhizobium sp. RP14(2022)]|uniref:Glutathione-dependent peroxiredoxin n=1 Tax=Mesorhizobium liriopis TaxID=2953882 RepID=A0ABT1C147_9HYPH|nr:redoxin family protein [Mesorhizobium liriopis]MCO6048555.1 redoxin family protein [Mesorhizobium liriopis]